MKSKVIAIGYGGDRAPVILVHLNKCRYQLPLEEKIKAMVVVSSSWSINKGSKWANRKCAVCGKPIT